MLAEIFVPAEIFVLAGSFVPTANFALAGILCWQQFLCLQEYLYFVCFAALRPQVNNYGHGKTVSSPNHIFPGEA